MKRRIYLDLIFYKLEMYLEEINGHSNTYFTTYIHLIRTYSLSINLFCINIECNFYAEKTKIKWFYLALKVQ